IGAYQVREYIRQIGGTVEVSSSPGQGTRFLINLPVSPQSEGASGDDNAAGALYKRKEVQRDCGST
ncbi:MAG TPA: hypothetical protein VFS24_16360, partial [Steroidobacteraceae bacterium]|nr:hypothetical protein [Steroidobacteraceae bacterium]